MRISDWSSDVCSSDLQQATAKALREGMIRYDRGKGWSGPIATIEADDQWASRLASSFKTVDYADWRIAAVLSKTGSEARIGFADGSTGRLPASAAQIDRKSTRLNSSH